MSEVTASPGMTATPGTSHLWFPNGTAILGLIQEGVSVRKIMRTGNPLHQDYEESDSGGFLVTMPVCLYPHSPYLLSSSGFISPSTVSMCLPTKTSLFQVFPKKFLLPKTIETCPFLNRIIDILWLI